jgi:hypothetical protein
MQRIFKILMGIGILVVLAMGFLMYLPYLFIGSPLPLLSITNDDYIHHSIDIEIIDSHNNSMFKKTYELDSQKSVSQPKPLWLLLQLSYPFYESKHIVKITLDDTLMETHNTRINPWKMVIISITNRNLPEDSPLEIEYLMI